MNINWQQLINSSLGLKLWVLIWVAILLLTNTVSLWYLNHSSGLWTAIAWFGFFMSVSVFLLFYQKEGLARCLYCTLPGSLAA